MWQMEMVHSKYSRMASKLICDQKGDHISWGTLLRPWIDIFIHPSSHGQRRPDRPSSAIVTNFENHNTAASTEPWRCEESMAMAWPAS